MESRNRQRAHEVLEEAMRGLDDARLREAAPPPKLPSHLDRPTTSTAPPPRASPKADLAVLEGRLAALDDQRRAALELREFVGSNARLRAEYDALFRGMAAFREHARRKAASTRLTSLRRSHCEASATAENELRVQRAIVAMWRTANDSLSAQQ